MNLNHIPNGRIVFLVINLVILLFTNSNGQEYNTISNWDGIAPDWYVSTPGSDVVPNPLPDTVNESGHCFKFITGDGPYDFMLTELEEPVNFDINPRYRIKVLAPASGGDITLKFENYDNSFWQEIVLTPVPGQWTDLEYDFSGLVYNDLVKLVIFPDFLGTTPGLEWYIDDVVQEIGEEPGPLELESNLPIFVINTDGVPIPVEPKITAHIGIIDNGPGMMNNLDDPFTSYNGPIGIEIRGQSSMMFPKKSYAFETRDETGENLNVSLLGMPPENDWALYAPYTDKSMLRNIVSFELGRKMGNYCSRSACCEVVIDDDYKGVYTLMEKIKKDDNRVDIATLDPTDISGVDLTGGYIIKVDKIDLDFQYGEDGWKSNPSPAYPNAKDITFQYFYPEADDIVPEQKDYIRDFITQAENSLTIYYFSNPYLGYQKYFDVLSFIDFMLLSEIAKEVDKYRYSTYFYKEKDNDGGKLFAGPAWDFDLGYGNVDYWDPGLDHSGWMYLMVEAHEWSIMFWWKRLMEDPYFRDMAFTRWTWLRQNKLGDDAVHSLIDSVLVVINEAKDRNYERWPILGTYVWPNHDWYGNTYADEVEYFESFLFPRLEWMDNSLTGNMLNLQAGITDGQNKILVHLYGDYFCRSDLKPSYFEILNVPGAVTIDSVIYINASECTLLLSGDVSDYPQACVIISEKAINYWLDITSSPLSAAGINYLKQNMPGISLFEENGRIHILSDQPGSLPDDAEIINTAGLSLGRFKLEKKNENIIAHRLNQGFYLFVMETAYGPKALKFIVSGKS
jgi:hypothetical protein